LTVTELLSPDNFKTKTFDIFIITQP
jgi:hypothetical protein